MKGEPHAMEPTLSAPRETAPAAHPPGRLLDLRTLGLFLLGDRSAIERVFCSPAAFWVGLLLVVSAGLAREYDGEYLVAQPWYVFVPLALSLPMAVVLWTLAVLVVSRRGHRGLFRWSSFRGFISCYWMTAPLAWAYGVPWERMLDEVGSVSANLWTLKFVAVWRALLMMRVLAVLLQRPLGVTLPPVLVFGAAGIVIARMFAPVPLMAIMGGLRLPASERMVYESDLLTFLAALFSIPFTSLVCLLLMARRPQFESSASMEQAASASAGLWRLALAAILVWLPFLPMTQREQRNRDAVERLYARGEVRAALEYASARQPADFPPAWRPPPLSNWDPSDRSLEKVLPEFTETFPAWWLRQLYYQAFVDSFDVFRFSDEWNSVSASLVDAVAGLPDRPQLNTRAIWYLGAAANEQIENRDQIVRLLAIYGYTPESATQPAPASQAATSTGSAP